MTADPSYPHPVFGTVTLQADPVAPEHAARKGYVDSAIANIPGDGLILDPATGKVKVDSAAPTALSGPIPDDAQLVMVQGTGSSAVTHLVGKAQVQAWGAGGSTPTPTPTPSPTPTPTPTPAPTAAWTAKNGNLAATVNVSGGPTPNSGNALFIHSTTGAADPASVHFAYGASSTAHPVQYASGGEYGINNSDSQSMGRTGGSSYPDLWTLSGTVYVWPNGHTAGSTRTLYAWVEVVEGSGNWFVVTDNSGTPFAITVTY